MSDFSLSLGGLDNFLAYFAMGIGLLVVFIAAYVHITPYREIALIRQGNVAASLSLSGAMLGFVIPLASAIAHSVAWWDMLLWGAVALVVQLIAYLVARVMFPTLAQDIQSGQQAQGLFLGALSLGVGMITAASMTY